MTIVVLDYCTGNCDVLQNVDAELIKEKFEGNVELYLDDIGYHLSEICYMVPKADDPVCYKGTRELDRLYLNKGVHSLLEVAIDIAYSLGYDQEMADDRQDLIPSVIRWTFEFERRYAGYEWQDKGDYIDRIDEFIAEKVTEWRSCKR